MRIRGGIVDQNIHTAEFRDCSGNQIGDRFCLARMRSHSQCCASVCADIGGENIQGFLLAAGQYHHRPGIGICPGDSFTDAA